MRDSAVPKCDDMFEVVAGLEQSALELAVY
jgi:hypothetical protein